ncbi:hypothetical protein TBR22_A44560 [Luteitalea sp. TBR-22]|uniref:S1 family peptidase n=1 Tax=Luteitalea sp. TBR-22 TaxID=2802971 RepID=UPI001AF2C85A|nr:S1 family peptidase [Luteitalea sp. TBR-22]BCS35229.1 hypothetical protein TBR22_A44560 [Luteitalea sp. TBR-22]
MRLDSARSLKAELLGDIIEPMVVEANRVHRAGARAVDALERLSGPDATFGIRARALDAVPAVPRSIALGVSRHDRQFRLAVRIQRPSLRHSTVVERLVARAKGEVDLRVVGRIDKRAVAARAAVPWHRSKLRPLLIGGSIGHVDVTAGTIGAFVRHRGSVHVLSNNHVLANEDLGRKGDLIVQPGVIDGGRAPRDTVATLGKWIRFRTRGANAVDAALARLQRGVPFDHARLRGLVRGKDRVLAGLGPELVDEGHVVYKVGRTTGATRGRVTAFDLDNVVVEYEVGNVRFDGQIEIEGTGRGPFSDGGDSGSLILDEDMRAVALLFAGSDSGGRNGQGLTFANPIHTVLESLGATLLS